MVTLAFDTSTQILSLVLAKDGEPLASFDINADYTHSQYLLPLIEKALEITRLKVSDVDLLAVIRGPGSFTGLRIGLAAAKALSVAGDVPIYTYTSLELLAANARHFEGTVLAMLPAQRGEVYAGLFCLKDGKSSLVDDLFLAKPADFLPGLLERYPALRPLGPGYLAEKEVMDKFFREEMLLPAEFHRNNIVSLLPTIVADQEAGRSGIAAEELMPLYMRKAAAEEKKAEAEK